FFDQFFGGNDSQFLVPGTRQNGTEKQEVGGGTGFIISPDGMIVTNKHVVTDEQAEYTVLMNDEKKYPAKVLARDPVSDLAILKIETKDLPTVELGDSGNLKVGQSVIAIGNALGEFRNTVSVGVISGLARSITADGAGTAEDLTNIIQTDAAINPGNSGGPLLNIAGQVIGINTAVAQGAQGIGFAIPINEVKNSIEAVQKTGKISRPWLGVRYVMLTDDIAKQNNLSVTEGALVARGDNRTDLAVIPGSPADKAGITENDIILEINGQKINSKNLLANALSKFKPGDEVTFKVWHKGEKKDVKVKLEEYKNS
ncbi:MAG: trypsin-like peptidase domain-containing protein, partial [Patescibacteria group bacterium]